MATAKIAPFPCCCKRHCLLENIHLNRILQLALQPVIFHINKKTLVRHFIQGSLNDKYNVKNFTVKEAIMSQSVYRLLMELLMELLNNDRNPVDEMTAAALRSLDDIGSTLKQTLNAIVAKHNEKAKNAFEVMRGNVTYQRLVLDILIHAVKFMSQCIDLLPQEDMLKIFFRVIENTDEFLRESNIASWIQHEIKVTNPFGNIPQETLDNDWKKLCGGRL